MAEEVGSIYFDVDVNTGELIDSVRVVDKSTKQMGKSIDGLNTKMKGAAKAVKGASGNMGGFGRKAGQAGIQVQQLVGQVQGGTNAMVALSQQAADLGIVLGVPLVGAIAGIAAAVGSALLPSLFDSKTEMEKLEKATESLGDAAERNKQGVIGLTEEIRKLAEVSEDAAIAQLAQETVDAKNVINQAGNVVTDAADSFGILNGETADASRALKEMQETGASLEEVLDKSIATSGNYGVSIKTLGDGVNRLSEQWGTSRQSTLQFLAALEDVRNEATPENIQELQNLLGGLNEETNFSNEALLEFQSKMKDAFSEARNAGEILDAVETFMSDFNKAVEDSSDAVIKQRNELAQLMESLQNLAITTGMTEREQAKYIASLNGASQAQLDQIDTLYDVIEQKNREEDATKKANAEHQKAVTSYQNLKQKLSEQIAELENADQAFEDYVMRQREAAIAAGGNADEIERMIRKLRELKEAQEDQKKAEQERKRLGGLVGTLGVTDEAQIMAQRNQQLLDLDRLKNEGLLANEQDYLNRKMEINRDAEESLKSLRDKAAKEQLLNWESIENQAIGALTSIATGAQDSREAIRGLAISIAQQAVGALLKMAIAGVTAQSTQAATAAATGSAIAAAYTPAAIAANIASFGGAATAAAATAPLAATATQAAINFGGGRLYGGGVSPGKIYPVTENGKPELFQSGNKSYLLPGSRGNVVSNKDMQGGAANVNIQVNVQNNMSGASVDVQSSSSGSGVNRQEVLNIIVSDINSRGRVHKAITSTTSANNKTT